MWSCFQIVRSTLLVSGVLVCLAWTPAWAQSTGTIRGSVTLTENGDAIAGALVLVIGPGQTVLTNSEGMFVVEDVPVGTYEILAQREHLTASRQAITILAGETTTVEFELALSPVHEEVTVTATVADSATTYEAFNAISTLDAFDLVTDAQGSLGEALENEPGVWKRSFGPGSSRPIIRGFDGDRVLIMEDGVRTGDLASQSADHGTSVDPNGLERIEIVRGPATLLYGSNAVGGVINTITPHESYRNTLTEGTRGQFSVDGGSANRQAGTNGSMQHAQGPLMMWAGGGTRRTDDYNTPAGKIKNSATRLSNGRAGVGYFGEHLFVSSGVTLEDGRYGVPFAEDFHGHDDHAEEDHEEEGTIDVGSTRRVGNIEVGMRDLNNRFVNSLRMVTKLVDWQHDELEVDHKGVETIGTTFNNRSYIARIEMDQRQTNRVAGKFGVWAQFRDYVAKGEEALAPATDQVSLAAFAYEELSFGRYRFQLGGRIERNAYSVAARQVSHDDHDDDHLEAPAVRNRDFNTASGSVGFQTDLGETGAFVVNLTRSYRAPALEELYNFGPHVGNLTFEVGNPNLDTESTLGLDVSLRHQATRLRGDFNFYIYDIDNFVFPSQTNQIKNKLRVANFLQGDARFVGFDAKASARLGASVWANLGIGLVNAELTKTRQALPRIPPLRAQLSFNFTYRGLTVTPEWIVSAKQNKVDRYETTTNGYSLLNVKASYVWPMQHMAHILAVSGYNLTNESYQLHTSFIKDLAPEIGRGVKVSYSLRFF